MRYRLLGVPAISFCGQGSCTKKGSSGNPGVAIDSCPKVEFVTFVLNCYNQWYVYPLWPVGNLKEVPFSGSGQYCLGYGDDLLRWVFNFLFLSFKH